MDELIRQMIADFFNPPEAIEQSEALDAEVNAKIIEAEAAETEARQAFRLQVTELAEARLKMAFEANPELFPDPATVEIGLFGIERSPGVSVRGLTSAGIRFIDEDRQEKSREELDLAGAVVLSAFQDVMETRGAAAREARSDASGARLGGFLRQLVDRGGRTTAFMREPVPGAEPVGEFVGEQASRAGEFARGQASRAGGALSQAGTDIEFLLREIILNEILGGSGEGSKASPRAQAAERFAGRG